MAEEKDKPGFDERTLGRLLEAAFVLQEHSEELRQIRAELERKAKLPREEQVRRKDRDSTDDAGEAHYGSALGRIIDTQRQIQTDHLNADAAMSLIAEQLTEICGSAGSAIGLVEGSSVEYRAVAGIRTPASGSSLPLEKALCFPCIRSGQVLSCADVKTEVLIDSQECKRRGIGSLIAVPVFHQAGIAGGVELYFSDAGAFHNDDIHTCQLMAALVAEALTVKESTNGASRAAGSEARNSEVLQPRSGASRSPVKQAVPKQIGISTEPAAAACYKCGHELLGDEQFCGECGAPRSTENALPNLQSKVASLWHMQQAEKKIVVPNSPTPASSVESTATNLNGRTDDPQTERIQVSNPTTATANPVLVTESHGDPSANSAPLLEAALESPESAEAPTPEAGRSADWSSALSAKEFFEQLAAGNRQTALVQFWNARRGDIYLAIAVILVIAVIGWGIRANRVVKAKTSPPPPSVAARKQPAAPEISLFDRMLISVGLAEAPQPPEYKGNPATRVWEDLRTGLYYCPGTDMYGKTQRGKYTSQRDAQLDRFEPAYRRACE